jgi:glucose-1-phosphate thymidylyltransferase
MEIAKALILTGEGPAGSWWPTAPGVPKHLFPVANQPILFHNLRQLRDAGVREATILVEQAGARMIANAVGDGDEFGLSIRCSPWESAVGLRGALASGRRFVADEPVLVQRGDALLRSRMDSVLAAFDAEGLDALALELAHVAAPAVETPAHPGWLLSPRAVSILLEEPEDLTTPFAGVEARGGRVRVQRVDGLLGCDGDQGTLLECNRAMLLDLVGSAEGADVERSELQGPVRIHPSASVHGSTIRGPVIIGPGAHVRDSYIGPYTSIGARAVIDGTEIEHSIVLPEAQLSFLGSPIESSVIGRRARVGRSFRLPSAVRLSIGDGAEVTFA